MPIDLEYSYQAPSEGDESSTTWFGIIVSFITRMVTHKHDNIDSALLSSNTPGLINIGQYFIFNSQDDAVSYDTDYFMKADGSTIDDAASPLDGITVDDLGDPDLSSPDDTKYSWLLRYK